MPTRLEFDYYTGDPPNPDMPPAYQVRYRPVAYFVTLRNPGRPAKAVELEKVTIDSGCEITLFDKRLADLLDINLVPVPPTRWRGERRATWFGEVELEITDSTETLVWTATVSFADFKRNLLGRRGCLEFLDAHFLGPARKVILVAAPVFPGTTTAPLET